MSSAAQRLSAIAGQITGGGESLSRKRVLAKNADDIVCISFSEMWFFLND